MDSVIYKELSALTKNKERWEENIPYVTSLLNSESTKIKAKALWLLGEMGLAFPLSIKDSVPAIASFLSSPEPLLRERAVNALGRIGRGCYESIEPYWVELFRFAHDEAASVRLAFIWASENIATITPDPYRDYMPLYAELLNDNDDRVRMEAPEMFRVLGKRRPDFVKAYLMRKGERIKADINGLLHLATAPPPCRPWPARPTQVRVGVPSFGGHCFPLAVIAAFESQSSMQNGYLGFCSKTHYWRHDRWEACPILREQN